MQAPFLRNDAEMEVAKNIVDVMSNLDMTNQEKVNLLMKVNRQAEEEYARLSAIRDRTKTRLDSLKIAEEWLSEKIITIEKNECSRLHLLRQSAIDRDVFVVDGTGNEDAQAEKLANSKLLRMGINSFVVKHDWSAALGGFDKAEDVIFPYDHCCFEFRINGRVLIVIALQHEGEKTLAPFLEINGSWLYLEFAESMQPLIYAWEQIKAICIALDADIATHHVERAPINLNKKREAKGRIPLNDYHVVNLAKRHRIANPSNGTGEHGKVRLHFRRGHWRHYETTKTWIKWCLVGNPDLGFIKKHYSL